MKNSLFLSLQLIILSFSVHADYRMVLEDQGHYVLSQRMVYLEDVDNALSIQDVLNIPRSDWSHTSDSRSSFGYSQSAYWVYVPFEVDHEGLWYLWLRYAPLDYVTFYWVKNGEILQQYNSGDRIAFDQRQVRLPENVTSRFLEKGEKISIYIRTKTQGSYRVPLEVHQSQHFESTQAELLTFQGIYYGVLLVMSVFNFVLYFITGIRSYLHYVFYVATSLASRLSIDGTGFQFLWPNYPALNEWAVPISFWLSSLAFWLFSYTFLNLNKAGTKTKWYFWILGAFGVLLGMGIPSMEYHEIVPWITLFAMLLMLSSLIVSIFLTVAGYRYAGVFAIATMMTALSFALTVLESLGVYSDQTFMVYSYPLARMFEIVLFAVALGVRIRFLQNRRIDAEKEAIIHREKSIASIQQYKRLYESAMTGNFVLCEDGQVKSANTAFYELLGESTESDIENYFDEKIMEQFRKESKRADYKLNTDIEAKNGKWLAINLYKVCIEGVDQFEGSIVDITDRVQAEELRQQAETNKMKSLQQLVVGIAHEINTPLGIVRTSSDYSREIMEHMREAMEKNTLTKSEFLDKISASSEALKLSEDSLLRITDLIKSFKHVSVEQMSFQLEKLELDTLVERLEYQSKLNEINIAIKVNNQTTEDFNTFAEGIYWSLNEMLMNAAEFSKQCNVVIEFAVTDKELTIHFYDNGAGVDEMDLPQIFDPFFTTGRGIDRKLGLGLYQVHNIIIQLLNGKIRAYNDNGLHFEMHIPVMDVK